MASGERPKIGIEGLRPGMYVDLQLPWMKHPFLFSRFKITKQEEIDIIRGLGLAEITIVPDRSDPEALKPPEAAPAQSLPPAEKALQDDMWTQKQEMIARNEAFRAERQKIAVAYQETVKKVTGMARDMRTGPANTVAAAEQIVDEMLDAFAKASEVLVNLVNLSDSSFTVYNHALNVTVLSVLLARSLTLETDEIHAIGMGALLHDLGKNEIPPAILNKRGKLTPGEEGLLRTHPAKGVKLAQRVQAIPPEVAAIIENHHEFLDGSGYPRGLRDPQIWLPVRVVAIANIYDNLCNPPDPAHALSPRDAMAVLYRNYQGKLDTHLVTHFIRAMGVYPPGTIVRLSDESIGMVVSVDSAQLLRPRVILHNPDVPRLSAMMVDLRERADLEVAEVLKPTDCPPALYEYLGISERLGYFYETR